MFGSPPALVEEGDREKPQTTPDDPAEVLAQLAFAAAGMAQARTSAAQTADGAAARRAIRRPRRDRRLKDTEGSPLVLVVGAAYPSLTLPTPRPFQAGVSGAGFVRAARTLPA